MKTFVATLLGLALSLGIPAGAQADSQQVTDATADVYEQGTPDVDPLNVITDVTSAKLTYGRRLSAKVTVPGMDLTYGTRLVVIIKRPDGHKFAFLVTRTSIGNITVLVSKKGVGQVPCDGTSVGFDDGSNRVFASLPSKCFGSPATVKVGAIYSSEIDFSTYNDDIRATGVPGGPVELGPPLRRF